MDKAVISRYVLDGSFLLISPAQTRTANLSGRMAKRVSVNLVGRHNDDTGLCGRQRAASLLYAAHTESRRNRAGRYRLERGVRKRYLDSTQVKWRIPVDLAQHGEFAPTVCSAARIYWAQGETRPSMRLLIIAASIAFAAPAVAAEITIVPGPDAQEELQEALILAQSGDEIVLSEGFYPIRNQLSLTSDNVTLRGAGMDKSVLSFKEQRSGSEGLLVTGNGAVLQDFTVEDTPGDGIKAKGVDGIAFVDVRVEWTRGPSGENGGYGFYPVSSRNVLLDGVVAIGASDAGIYVGQSENIIVRNSRGEFNVAGLEIENSYYADVYHNHLENNTGGILIFDLPDIPQQGGHDVRVFDNVSVNNNTPNFAPEGGIVSIVPTGTGMLVMGNTDVEVFGNRFENNNSGNLFFATYVLETEDENFQPYPRRVHIHDNTFSGGGNKLNTDEEFGAVLADIFGDQVPHIVWDGRMPMMQYLLLGMPDEHQHSIHSNTFDDLPPYGNADFIGYFGLNWFHGAGFDISEHSAELPRLAPARVTIRGKDVEQHGF